jgi:hypothetical protein
MLISVTPHGCLTRLNSFHSSTNINMPGKGQQSSNDARAAAFNPQHKAYNPSTQNAGSAMAGRSQVHTQQKIMVLESIQPTKARQPYTLYRRNQWTHALRRSIRSTPRTTQTRRARAASNAGDRLASASRARSTNVPQHHIWIYAAYARVVVSHLVNRLRAPSYKS